MKRKTPNRKLLAAWEKRNKLVAEVRKLWTEGDRLRADGDKLWAEGHLVFRNIVLAECGNTNIYYKSDGSCVLGTGEVLPAPKKERP